RIEEVLSQYLQQTCDPGLFRHWQAEQPDRADHQLAGRLDQSTSGGAVTELRRGQQALHQRPDLIVAGAEDCRQPSDFRHRRLERDELPPELADNQLCRAWLPQQDVDDIVAPETAGLIEEGFLASVVQRRIVMEAATFTIAPPTGKGSPRPRACD